MWNENVRTTDYEQVKHDRKFGRLIHTRSGRLTLVFPTNLNKALKSYRGKDLDLDMKREGDAILLTLTDKECSRSITFTMTGL